MTHIPRTVKRTQIESSPKHERAGKQTQAWDGKHDAACEKPPAGTSGCRLGAPFPHPVNAARCVRVRDVMTTAEGRGHMREEIAKMQAQAEVA